MATVTLNFTDTIHHIEANVGDTLLSVMQQTNGTFSAPCGGNHTCGKCLVAVCGAVSAPTDNETNLLPKGSEHLRLACFATVQGDCELTANFDPNQKTVTEFAPVKSHSAPLFSKGTYGVAVDIGTTTIAAYLFGAGSTTPLAILGEYNHQQQFGGDVMARISYANETGLEPLRTCITGQLSRIFHDLCSIASIDSSQLTTAVITGNTTMLHLLMGMEPRSLACCPFTPLSLFGDWMQPNLPDFSHLQVYLPSCISAYVGADITCGMMACDLPNRKGNVLFADIGTNGEMALKTDNGILCCSTAAGPAFEGAGISCGCGAVAGAINNVKAIDGELVYETIDNAPSVGICGSGLIDAIAAGLELGMIDPKGRVSKELNNIITFPNSAITLTQGDIRQFQLAKGAIRAGMDTLLHDCQLTYEDIDEVVLCGGFGSFINVQSAENVCLLPPRAAQKTIAIGNAAGNGAVMALMGGATLEAFVSLAKEVSHTELSTNSHFARRFIRSMNFKETE